MDDIDMSTILKVRNILGIAEDILEEYYGKKKRSEKVAGVKLPPGFGRKATTGNKPRRNCHVSTFDTSPGSEARSLSVIRRPDGSAVVQIDEGGKFTLPTTMAELLLILAADTGHSDDALIGWKSLSEISRRLSAKKGKAVRRKTVIQSIFRLRNELDERAQGAGRFVQTDVEAGARFTLRR